MQNLKKAFSSFSVNDIQKAQEFYTDVLKLDVTAIPEGLSLQLPETKVFIYPKGDGHQPANFTVLNFEISNIDSVVDDLSKKGITFEKYDNEFMKTDAKGIARDTDRSMAWFKDPAGNFLALIEMKG